MMKQYRHVIWDFNGTLFDDFELCFSVLREVLTAHKIPLIDRETYRGLFCHPLIEFYRRIGFVIDEAAFADLSKQFHVLYEARLGECGLHEYAPEILDWCRQQGLTQSILSALPHSILDGLIDKFSLGQFFSEIRGASDFLAEGKIGAAEKWMAGKSFKPKDVILVGDTDHDGEVASALGVSCVLLAQGFQARSVLEPCGFPVFDTLGEFFASVSS